MDMHTDITRPPSEAPNVLWERAAAVLRQQIPQVKIGPVQVSAYLTIIPTPRPRGSEAVSSFAPSTRIAWISPISQPWSSRV